MMKQALLCLFLITAATSCSSLWDGDSDNKNAMVLIPAADFLMGGTTTDDEKLQLPYLTQAPATLANGMMWMENDGLHIYYNGAEKIVAGI